jgi:hypothetical protein
VRSASLAATSPPLPQPSAIRLVSCYVASPVETCDCCSAGIKYVSVVHLKDGSSLKYGSKCIEKILAGDTSLKGLYRRNAKRLQELKADLAILTGPEDAMPVDERQYQNRGLVFILNARGSWMTVGRTGHMIFHPTKMSDEAREAMTGANEHICFGSRAFNPPTCWVNNTPENWALRCRAEIQDGIKWINGEIARIEPFLARVLAKGLAPKSPA